MTEPLTASVLGLTLRSPLVVGSGLLTDQERNIRRLLAAGVGAVVTKTIHPNPPEGTDERLHRLPTGLLNSTTYSRRPVTDWCTMLRGFAEEGLPVIANVHADSPGELADLVTRVAEAGAPALELGISCLNEEGGLHDTAERVARYTRAVRAVTDLPFSVKLALGEGAAERVAAAVLEGAAAVTISDTIPGLVVDAGTGEVGLGGVYGYSGPGIKPLVLAEIYQLRRAGVGVPVLASGGVRSAEDVAEYLSVGAQAVQVYTALHEDMHGTLAKIQDGFATWIRDRGTSVAELVGRSVAR
ncbi:dihydroorotate dehydrogenase [Crossiella equi]|uniref:Dihydroorotate dehydrogenase n=1 Tax=Crossiella equi TaxID=130796 RepID=A0ABS5A5N5_9PSEU|nr:hypothetical protein [Crossiella equi]MBP2471908.1 dihydroorotate dehydrogenase [Crossiella equi]